jgi:hypothetical protein
MRHGLDVRCEPSTTSAKDDCRKTNSWRLSTILGVLLLSCSFQAFSKSIRVTAFPASTFSPDGTSVYYVRSELQADLRRVGSFSLVYARNKEIRVISEIISIHKFDLATGRDEVVATLPRPAWAGTGKWVARQFWFDGEEAKMWWSRDGELQYQIRGPWTVTMTKQGVHQAKKASFASSDPRWTDWVPHGPTPTLRTEQKFVVSGNLELVTSWRFGDQGRYYLVILDHSRKAARMLATGSDLDRKLAPFSYHDMLLGSELVGTF